MIKQKGDTDRDESQWRPWAFCSSLWWFSGTAGAAQLPLDLAVAPNAPQLRVRFLLLRVGGLQSERQIKRVLESTVLSSLFKTCHTSEAALLPATDSSVHPVFIDLNKDVALKQTGLYYTHNGVWLKIHINKNYLISDGRRPKRSCHFQPTAPSWSDCLKWRSLLADFISYKLASWLS